MLEKERFDGVVGQSVDVGGSDEVGGVVVGGVVVGGVVVEGGPPGIHWE